MGSSPHLPGDLLDTAAGYVVTRTEARELARQLAERYPEGTVEVTRVFGGVEVEACGGGESVFIRAADDSPLLALLLWSFRCQL